VNHTLLYIEDHAYTRGLVEKILRKLRPHINLHTATNARDGIKTATTQHPALILLDNHLPDATGAEVLHHLTSCEATATIPVIIVSGDSAKNGNQLLAAGAAEFLPKPFDIDQLITMIDRYIH
jgi:CheY-like chemotaxis protein